jgi:hypothetical protein
MMNWKGYERKWHNPGIFLKTRRKAIKTTARIASLWARILSQDPQNMKPEC